MSGAEDLLYKGHRLLVRPHGAGWKLFIYRPGSSLAETTIPNGRNRDDVIAEAKRYVDGLS